MAIYMKIDGLNGDVTTKGHEQWIKIESLKFGAQRSLSTEVGRIADRESSLPSISEVTVTKPVDQTSPYLFSEACTGEAKQVKIDLCQTGTSIDPYMQYTLSNAVISGYQVSIEEAQKRPVETIKISMTKIENRYTPYNDSNKAGSPISTSYDLRTGQANS